MSVRQKRRLSDQSNAVKTTGNVNKSIPQVDIPVAEGNVTK